MKSFPLLCCLILVHTTSATPQTSGQDLDPLHGNYALGTAANPVLLWSGGAYRKAYQYLSLGNPALSDSLRPSAVMEDTTGGGSGALDAAAGDFNGDDREDVVFVWEGPERSIRADVPQIDPVTLNFTASHAMEIAPPGSLTDPYKGQGPIVRLIPGAFTTRAQQDLLLAYLRPDGHVPLRIYEVDSAHTLRFVSELDDFITPYDVPNNPGSSAMFDIATGDVDADGTDEIVLAGGRQLACGFNAGCWEVAVRLYDVDPVTRAITFRADTVIFQKINNSNRWLSRIAVSCGRLTDRAEEQIAVVFEDGTYDATVNWYLQALEAAPDLSALKVNTSRRASIDSNLGSVGFSLALSCADLDGNGIDEIVYAGRQLKIYGADSLLNLTQKGGGGFGSEPEHAARRWMVIADLDADADLKRDSTTWRPEIILATTWMVSDNGGISSYPQLRLGVYSWTGPFNLKERVVRTDDHITRSSFRQLALAAADVGARGIRVGTPKRYTVTNVVEPLVILNAPPTHFDVFGASTFDISGCASIPGCGFTARYETQSQRTISMTTEFKRDWAVGAKASGGFTIPKIKIGVQVKLEATYGQNFSRSNRTSETFTVNQAVTAALDDQIYAAISSYDIWEYPLISDGALDGYIMVSIPKPQTRSWFDSKSWNARTYIPNHEVGQILSYREVTTPGENPLFAEDVRWSTADQYTINGTSSYEWGLTAQNQTVTTTSHRSRFRIGGSADFDLPFKFLPDISISGDYSQESLSASSSTVTDQKGLYVNLGNANLSFGNTRYSITPYVYWAKNGALVLDYAVSPELAAPGFDPTWWQMNYGAAPDPTFILPWRSDRARGLSVTDAQMEQTKDIIFEPATPQGGGSVHATARIQNFSLLPTAGPVKARFFIGDPDSGGTVITGNDGAIDRFTDDAIASRGTGQVDITFAVPADRGQYLRIFVRLDPDQTMTEIHENNNTAWTVLTLAGPTTGAETGEQGTPQAFALDQNFPNPFNPTTRISYSVPATTEVSLIVYDILGREVAVLARGMLHAGTHTAQFDAAGLASGVYVYRLIAGERVSSRKMILMK